MRDKNVVEADHLFSIDITVTSGCNFKCRYCVEGDSCDTDVSFSNFDELYTTIEKMFVDEWFNSNFEGIKIGFWGGEPTIRPDIIKAVVDKYKDDKRIYFFVFTNGHSYEVLDSIFHEVKHKITIQVSYDGDALNRKNRIYRDGSSTTGEVKRCIYSLFENGYTTNIKSTATYDDMSMMCDSWDDIKLIYDDLGKGIKYAITIDYSKAYDMDACHIRSVFTGIAKRELKFYKEHGHHLFTWFDGGKTKCTYMKSGFSLDANGELLYCHGCMYSCHREDLVFGHIQDADILDKIKANYEFFNAPVIPECDECLAKMCLTCNVQKHINSSKEGFYDRWYDLTCQKDQCTLFKEFGKVYLALEDILRR